MVKPSPTLVLPLALLVALTLTGCVNPYVEGFTGQRLGPQPRDIPVAVFGADFDDPVARQAFDQRLEDAQRTHTLLGSATTVSDRPLRDDTAADAARRLGADLVLYSFSYLNATIETSVTESFSKERKDDRRSTEFTRQIDDQTRHWFIYRAYFFSGLNDLDPFLEL